MTIDPTKLGAVDPAVAKKFVDLQTGVTALKADVSKLGNKAPVLVSNIPTVSFLRGVKSSFPITNFFVDPNGDALTITMNSVVLPAGVAFDGKAFNYDGIGAVGSVSGVQLTANDGKP